MTDDVERSIDASRRSFNRELLSASYSRVHHDSDHVSHLVAELDPQPGGTYLDLATGTGSVAFAIARHEPEARVIGTDIADHAIARNREIASEQGCANIEFLVTDGRKIGFPDATFDGIASRYALHHFPDLEVTLADARRVLRPTGSFVVADAVRHPRDEEDFINQFQALKPDGHVQMYTGEALVEGFTAIGFEAVGQSSSAISFTRDLDANYRALIDGTPPETLDLYGVKVDADRAALTIGVVTVRFVATPD